MRAPVNGIWRAHIAKGVVPMRDPDVLVLAIGAIQLARDVLALLRERASRWQIRMVIIGREEQ